MTAVALSRRVFLRAAIFAYLQIALGGVVRVTGSGLGCHDWPLCNGRPYPPADLNAIIEYSHRTVGAVTGVIILGCLIATAVLSMPQSPGIESAPFKRLAAAAVAGTYILLLSGSSVVAT